MLHPGRARDESSVLAKVMQGLRVPLHGDLGSMRLLAAAQSIPEAPAPDPSQEPPLPRRSGFRVGRLKPYSHGQSPEASHLEFL